MVVVLVKLPGRVGRGGGLSATTPESASLEMLTLSRCSWSEEEVTLSPEEDEEEDPVNSSAHRKQSEWKQGRITGSSNTPLQCGQRSSSSIVERTGVERGLRDLLVRFCFYLLW